MAAPVAAFEDPASIVAASSLRYESGRLFLGVVGGTVEKATDVQGRPFRFVQGGHEVGLADDRHFITVAGSRAGKGRAAIIPNMLRYTGSVLAIDPKGELARATAARRQALGQRVCVVDPFGTTEGTLTAFEAGFNPVAAMRSLIEDAVLIADALVLSGGKDPHWDESARTLIEGVILDVATAERFDGRRSLVTVRDLIGQGDTVDPEDGPNMDGLKAFMEASPVGMVQRAAADFFERPPNERASVLSTARRHLRALNFPEIERSLSRDGFDLADLKREPMTVYLCLPGRHMGTCAVWLRLFVNMALQAMERTPGAPAAPVLFVLDEFATLGHMRQIEDAAGQIAGYGVKLWPILQDLGQLKALYRDRWETFMGNAGALQFFGNNDLTTLEWISSRLGKTTIEQVSGEPPTTGGRLSGAHEERFSTLTTALIEPHEAALIFGRADMLLRQLIIRADFPPMILQRAYYDTHEAFQWSG